MAPSKTIIALAITITSCLCTSTAISASAPVVVSSEDRCKSNNINDGPFGIFNRANEVSYAVTISDDINALDAKLKSWGADGSQPMCLLDDGRPYISAIIEGYRILLKGSKWDLLLSEIKDRRKKRPQSAAYALLEAEYWIRYAWDARGSGFSSTVTDMGYKLFNERIEKAEKVLLDSKPYASAIPVWYAQMVTVQSVLDRPLTDRDKTFLEGTGKNKTYYELYFNMLNYLSPKWGGSWGTVENLVRWSVENTHETEGTSMYARLYWSTYSGLPEGVKLFGDTYASWPKMKKGFEDLMQRHPKSNWNLNNFAKFACLANDKHTYVSLRKRIGDDIEVAAWSGETTLDLCDHKMGYAK